MVGLVLVSHSRPLALAVQEMVRSMTGTALPLAIAAGAGENHAELGTDAIEISEAIKSVHGPDGVLVLMDMGSAILSSETALDLLDEEFRAGVRFCAAPFVEGAVAAGVTANLGSSLEEVFREAQAALRQKEKALAPQADLKADSSEEKPTAVAGPSVRVVVHNPHGLHARPAARLITEANRFQSEITIRNLTNARGPVSAKSLSRLASLEILQDQEIEIFASGPDQAQALGEIQILIESGLGEELPSAGSEGISTSTQTGAVRTSSTQPVPVSSGIAIGPAFYFHRTEVEIPDEKIDDVDAEISRLQTAVSSVQKNIEAQRDAMTHSVGAAHAGIYDAQALALHDPDLLDRALQFIRIEKQNAPFAWYRANGEVVARYRILKDPYLRERAVDLEDVGQQVLASLGINVSGDILLREPAILVADELTPGQVSKLSLKLVRGVIMRDGGPTAHSSILLNAMGIPAVVQARSALEAIDPGQPHLMVIDGTTGEIAIDPAPELLIQFQNLQAKERARARDEKRVSDQVGETQDGQRIEFFANIGSAQEAELSLEQGAEGIGLLRTEFLFLDRISPPSEDEQIVALRDVARRMKGRPVIVRTLDAGGDKTLPYLPATAELNPFLGVRAVRLCFKYEELFLTQLRAILRAGHEADLRVMFPMIAGIDDLRRARALLEQAHLHLEAEGIAHLWPISTGIMIEIPSAALQAEELSEWVDFFSIGTNDLTQYTLAADRGNPELASYQDALHPSVLRLIDQVVKGAKSRQRQVAVCGEAASDDRAAQIFVGLGVTELSMTASKIPRLKVLLRESKMEDLQKAARRALACSTAAEVRDLKD